MRKLSLVFACMGLLLFPALGIAALAVDDDRKIKNGWENVSPDVASKIMEQVKAEVCSFKPAAEGVISSSTLDGSIKLKADATATHFKSGNNWFALTLDSYGRNEAMLNVAEPEIRSEGTKLNLVREKLTEWYINHGGYLEHGLVLNEKPTGKGNLNFSFSTSGNLVPEQNGKDILFVGDNNMDYTGIKAWDATGRDLVCSMSVQQGNLVWSVDDSKAKYPVTVDPVLSLVKKFTGKAQDYCYFGGTLSLSGDLAIVGANSEEDAAGNPVGAVYIFSKNEPSENEWGLIKKLAAPNGGAFGSSVFLSGDLAVVGAYFEDSMTGAVYIFSKNEPSENEWGLVKKITGPGGAEGRFGGKVSLSGNLLLVGATAENTHAGAAYIFSKDEPSENEWGLVKKLTGKVQNYCYFGNALSLSGDLAIVGACSEEDADGNSVGAAYIFSKDEPNENEWGLVKKLPGPNGFSFGKSISLSGDLAIVGTTSRSAYIYSKDNPRKDEWGLVKKLTRPEFTEWRDDAFGCNVFLSGDLAIVGAPREDGRRGAVYIFSKDESDVNQWGLVNKLIGPEVGEWEFGNSFFLSGDLLLVGAMYENKVGAAYLYSTTSQTGEKIVVPVVDQPSGSVVTVNTNDKQVKTKDEIQKTYQGVTMDSMLGANVYEFTATVTDNKLGYFAFNSSSLGERKAGDVILYKLYTDKPSKTFTYSSDKIPSEEGYFWITDETNSGQYIDPKMVLEGARTYTVNYSIRDNGDYDLDPAPGAISDPVVPGTSSGGSDSGCVMNPQADFSMELAGLFVIALIGLCLRRRCR
ncbi:hypothetical protein D0S45_07650 [Marinifilum sp. JC120]|nr:hypothetical protein D0S45_07650 [Marinifilum sp. JC120]